MADDKAIEGAERKEAGVSKKKKQKRNIVSRIWNGLFRTRGDDFEKRLQYISKEEAAIIDRMKRRVQTWRLRSRQFILFSLFCEVLVVGFAIMMTRSTDLDWKIRAVYVLPMFVWPALSYFAHSALLGWTRRCDHKDQNTLERLRAERQTKIDELKERTNYYTTQQLIQRYDPDPAAKAAAATVLASKLGAESGLKMYWGEESTIHAPAGKSNDAEVVQQSGGLRKRKPLQTSISAGNTPLVTSGAVTPFSDGTRTPDSNQVVVDHHFPQGSSSHDGGWIARVAALLVGEDPTQSYALICGNCHMHNGERKIMCFSCAGLARKEDFQYITYYCPHCRALNRPKQSEETRTGCNTPHFGTLTATVSGDLMNNLSGSPRKSLLTSSSTTITAPVIEEKSENTEDADVVD